MTVARYGHVVVILAGLVMGRRLAEPASTAAAGLRRTVVERDAVVFAGLARDEANAMCEACHPTHAQEWRGSLHRAAFTDAAFQSSLAREPLPFCRGCHAPEADADAPPPAWAAAMGVGCVTCHLQGDDVLAAPRDDTDDAGIPHAVVRASSLADERVCAGCHEFEFPRSAFRSDGTLMQSTVREHAASAHAEASCADCHMPTASDGHLDHGFATTRSPERLRAALRTEAERTAATTLELHLEPLDVGHAFPTGDLNRRLVLEATAIDARGRTTAHARRELARHFPAPVIGASHVAPPQPPTIDDRLVGPTTIELSLPGARAGDRVQWRVVYERVDHRDPYEPAASTLFDAVELAAGEA